MFPPTYPWTQLAEEEREEAERAERERRAKVEADARESERLAQQVGRRTRLRLWVP